MIRDDHILCFIIKDLDFFKSSGRHQLYNIRCETNKNNHPQCFTTINFQKLLTYWTVIVSQHIFSKITSSQYFETEQIIAIHGASITIMTMATLLTGSPPSSTRRPLLKSVALPAISLQNFILQDFSPFHIFVLQVSSLFQNPFNSLRYHEFDKSMCNGFCLKMFTSVLKAHCCAIFLYLGGEIFHLVGQLTVMQASAPR